MNTGPAYDPFRPRTLSRSQATEARFYEALGALVVGGIEALFNEATEAKRAGYDFEPNRVGSDRGRASAQAEDRGRDRLTLGDGGLEGRKASIQPPDRSPEPTRFGSTGWRCVCGTVTYGDPVACGRCGAQRGTA